MKGTIVSNNKDVTAFKDQIHHLQKFIGKCTVNIIKVLHSKLTMISFTCTVTVSHPISSFFHSKGQS